MAVAAQSNISTNTLAPVRRTSPAAVIDESTFHLARMIADSAERFADRPATRIEGADGQWVVASYADFHRQILAFARALVARGIQPGDRIAIFANNHPEWSIADLGTLSAGAVVVPIFAASSAEQVRHILTDSGARMVVVEGEREAGIVADAMAESAQGPRVATFQDLWRMLDEDHADLADDVARRITAGRPDDVATIVYTSGTTGPSKGVMLTHGGFGNQMAAIDACWDFLPTDQSVCFLPLAHSLERDWTFHLFHSGALNTYCANPKRIAEVLAKARPNLLVSVPMLFEKVMQGAREQASSPVASKLMDWALDVGGRCQQASRKGKTPSLRLRAQLPLADKLVLSKIRAAIGGNKKLLVSGGAPLRHEVEDFFSAAGILLGQGYGLTESGPMMTIYRPDLYKLGTVGFVIRGSQIRIGEQGEILVRGGSVMKGYWNDPVATSEVIDDEGWLHTGDVGHIDGQGFITVTDRLKDIIVTANGKNVAPQVVEAALMADPVFGQVVVVGDARPCLVAIVQPNREGWTTVAEDLGLPDEPAALARDPKVQVSLRQRCAQLTEGLASYERVRSVVVSQDRITMGSGMLTATMKLRRAAIEAEFAPEVDDCYRLLAEERRR